VSINGWTVEENVVYIHNGVLVSHKEECNYVICRKIDGARDHYIKWNKLWKTNTTQFSLICGI
jgi:hypothetical protein